MRGRVHCGLLWPISTARQVVLPPRGFFSSFKSTGCAGLFSTFFRSLPSSPPLSPKHHIFYAQQASPRPAYPTGPGRRNCCCSPALAPLPSVPCGTFPPYTPAAPASQIVQPLEFDNHTQTNTTAFDQYIQTCCTLSLQTCCVSSLPCPAPAQRTQPSHCAVHHCGSNPPVPCAHCSTLLKHITPRNLQRPPLL